MLRHIFSLRVTILMAGLFCSVLAFSESYVVHPGDVLQIDIWDEQGLSREALVRPDGFISLPMAGGIDTTKSTPSQVGDKISQALGKYMKEPPRVVVTVVNVNGYWVLASRQIGCNRHTNFSSRVL